MNFSDLKSRALSVLGRAPDDIVYELVTADVNQRLRLRSMLTRTTLTAGETATLPSDFLAVQSVYEDSTPRRALLNVNEHGLNRGHDTSGNAREYSIANGTIYFNAPPTSNVVFQYYAELPDLVADSDENAVLTAYPSVYFYGVLFHHANLVRDMEAIPARLASYETAMQRAAAADRKSINGGPSQAPFVRTAP